MSKAEGKIKIRRAEVAIPVAMDEHGQWAVSQEIGDPGTAGIPKKDSIRGRFGPDHAASTLGALAKMPSTQIAVGWLGGVVEFRHEQDPALVARLKERLEEAEKKASAWQDKIEALREMVNKEVSQ